MDTQKEILGMKVSGNIISELSDRIPSNFMALNELIKNSYDADATLVKINILTDKKMIILEDNGYGMNKSGMENLLHIALSNKDYAIKRENGRITQGEKGLGSLATFHFGNSVTWETSQDNMIAYKFTVLKSTILEKDDISKYHTEIERLKANFRGTKITITDLQDDEFAYFVSTLENKKTTSKLVRSIYDSHTTSSFAVELLLDGKSCIDKKDLLIPENNNTERIYQVKFDSTDENSEIRFFYNDTLVFTTPFSIDSSLSDFKIKTTLNIYDLSGNISNADFPALYQKEQEKPDITPLVYINQSFFKNYTLFNVDIARQSSSRTSLPQITGEIEIWTQSSKLMFNADRTEINENAITAKLKTEIERLNKAIQKEGSKYKNTFRDMNRGKSPFTIIKQEKLNISGLNNEQIEIAVRNNISDDIYKNSTTFKINKDNVVYDYLGHSIEVQLFIQDQPQGKQNDKISSHPRQGSNGNSPKPAIITLKAYQLTKTIGITGQIDLNDFIVEKETKDSFGNAIPLNDITIKDDKGLMQTPNILPAITSAQEVIITYTYNDKKTGLESKTLTIAFLEPQKSPIQSSIKDTDLIHNHGIGGFKISFNNVAAKLVEQINKLDVNNYTEIIACSLRTLFELSIDAIKNRNSTSTKFNDIKSSISPKNKSLEDKVKEVVDFVDINNNRGIIANYLTKCSFANVSFDTLKNIADSERISSNAGASNLGAHKGTTNLTRQQIIDIANSVSAFLIFVEGIIGAADNF